MAVEVVRSGGMNISKTLRCCHDGLERYLMVFSVYLEIPVKLFIPSSCTTKYPKFKIHVADSNETVCCYQHPSAQALTRQLEEPIRCLKTVNTHPIPYSDPNTPYRLEPSH